MWARKSGILEDEMAFRAAASGGEAADGFITARRWARDCRARSNLHQPAIIGRRKAVGRACVITSVVVAA
jgi:hypothetical protein